MCQKLVVSVETSRNAAAVPVVLARTGPQKPVVSVVTSRIAAADPVPLTNV